MAHSPTQSPAGLAGRLRAGRAVTLVELLVVLTIGTILLLGASGLYFDSRKAGDLSGDIMKIQKVLATARSYAINSPDRHYQATFWIERSSFWIDEIQPSQPADTATTVLRAKIVTPESLSEQVVLADVRGGVVNTLSDGTKAVQVRFFSDGTSDDGALYVVRREAAATGNHYQKIRIYGPTGRTRLFADQPQPTPAP